MRLITFFQNLIIIKLKTEYAKMFRKPVISCIENTLPNRKSEIQRLQDEEYIARYAREKYLYSKNGELIIKID